MNRPILEVENVTKLFYPPLSFFGLVKLDLKKRAPITALKDISFSLQRGQILGILGPNAAGKTTLLKIISTLILPDKGKIIVGGYSVGNDDEKIKSIIGLTASEERSFYWRLTGRQNLEFFASLYDLNKEKAKSRIDELLKLFKVDYIHRRFGSYSTGMKRKFVLVKGLLHNPELLLLDEPTKSLDYNSSSSLRNFLKDIAKKGKTIIFATHNMAEAESLCDLFMILHKGKIYGLGSKEALRKRIGSVSAAIGDIYLKLTGNV